MSDLNNEQKYGAGVNPSFYSNLPADENKEKVFLGTIGAILGALAGALLIALLDKIGFVASISGVVMAYLSLFLYAKFAGILSKKGIIICVVIMVITVFLTEWTLYSIAVYKELSKYSNDYYFLDIFLQFYIFLSEPEILRSFLVNILMLYGFTALGAVPKIKEFSKRKPEDVSKPFSGEAFRVGKPATDNTFKGPNTSFSGNDITANANSVETYDEKNSTEE